VDAPGSAREAEAQARAELRLRRQRDTLRPLAVLVVVAVLVAAINGRPALSLHGEGLGVVAAFLVFAATLALAVRQSFPLLPVAAQAGVVVSMGASGVALLSLQPHGSAELAGSVAVWMAVTRLPIRLGAGLAAGVSTGVVLVLLFTRASASVIVAAALLCGLLALVAYFIKQARASQELTERLLAQLEDAREEQLQAAALEERSRIAGELHDVLAHSLSGAAIQLQGARKLVETADASPAVVAAIERAAELVREGLANARQAVSALHGGSTPGVADLDALVDGFRRDTNAAARLQILGMPYALTRDADLALYRGVQEALTNIARYAPGASTNVTLRYEHDGVSVTVEDRVEPAVAGGSGSGLQEVGGGNGLTGLRERLRRAGGDLRAGPTETGWLVELEVPA
jgi:signal transduction histidine kinase